MVDWQVKQNKHLALAMSLGPSARFSTSHKVTNSLCLQNFNSVTYLEYFSFGGHEIF
jgi:hypothetical protein